MPYINGKFYVEINPDTEIIRVEDESRLRNLDNLRELSGSTNMKALPNNELPQLRNDEVCAHWERELIFLSEVDFELSKKTGSDPIIGGYCTDCKQKLGQPKQSWYPKVSYK